MAESKSRTSERALGIAHAAYNVRTLLADYTRQRNLKEGEVGLILYGYLAARLGLNRLDREWPIRSGGLGRPPQVDFVIGRKRHVTGEWTPDTAIELAVARTGDPGGLASYRNKDEIGKLVESTARHCVLLLIDLLDEDRSGSTLDDYSNAPRAKGRPSFGIIRIVYVGAQGLKTRSIARQRFS